MSRAIAVLVTSLAVSAGPAAAQPPARDRAASAATGTARISGRVVSADNGRPVRAIVVRISAAELGEPKSTVTDPGGRYEIAELPASRFTVTAMKAGFVTISHWTCASPTWLIAQGPAASLVASEFLSRSRPD
jgi:hypothetical protein